jgi:hypothetical protein
MYSISRSSVFVDLQSAPCTVPEIIDPVFAKTSQNARFLLSENERFGLVFVKTGSINSGTGPFLLEKEGSNAKERAPNYQYLTLYVSADSSWRVGGGDAGVVSTFLKLFYFIKQ